MKSLKHILGTISATYRTTMNTTAHEIDIIDKNKKIIDISHHFETLMRNEYKDILITKDDYKVSTFVDKEYSMDGDLLFVKRYIISINDTFSLYLKEYYPESLI